MIEHAPRISKFRGADVLDPVLVKSARPREYIKFCAWFFCSYVFIASYVAPWLAPPPPLMLIYLLAQI